MSSMTSGVKIRLCPSTFWAIGAFSSVAAITHPSLEHELALGRLQLVVVVELLAAHELRELGRRAQAVDSELAINELRVGVGPLALHAVDPQRLDLTGDVQGAVVHGVAEARTDVAADDLAAALHHEARHRPGVTERDDGAALLIDAGAGAHPALDHEVAAADGRAGQRPGVALNHANTGHHVLARRPADAPGDVDLWTVDHPQREVAERPLKPQPTPGQDPRAQRVLGAGVEDRHVAHALLVQEPAQLQVDPARGQAARVERGAVAVNLRHAGDAGVALHQSAGIEP